MQKTQGTVTRVGQKHTNLGGFYKKARRWRVEERHRFITNQLYPTSAESGTGYREQFQQVSNHLEVLSLQSELLQSTAKLGTGHREQFLQVS